VSIFLSPFYHQRADDRFGVLSASTVFSFPAAIAVSGRRPCLFFLLLAAKPGSRAPYFFPPVVDGGLLPNSLGFSS